MIALDEIIAHKKKEVEEKKSLFPRKLLERSIYFSSQPVSLKKYLLREDSTGILAEFKRRSPSRGFINKYADIERTTMGYMQAGASALSVLTDTHFFGGKNEDLTLARKYNFCPILRKDFVIDEYQVIEAKSIGADAILLIAAVLTEAEVQSLTVLAESLGMEVLLEIHTKEELVKISAATQLIGVNNRNLKTMQVTLETSLELAGLIPASMIKVSESGINDAKQLVRLRESGYQGFLMGEYFMRHARPEQACMHFITEVRFMTQTLIAQ